MNELRQVLSRADRVGKGNAPGLGGKDGVLDSRVSDIADLVNEVLHAIL